MNFIDAVNQVLSGQDAANPEDYVQLLGLPGRLIGTDIAVLQDDLAAHGNTMAEQICRPVHPAVAFLDFLGLDTVEDFCILKKTSFQNLLQAAVYDRLTGLFSRNTMESRLHQEFQRARRYSLPLSLLFIDCDDFKNINDTHGHSEGIVCCLSSVGLSSIT